MKRPVIYFFIVVYLFSFTEVKQMLKFPNLAEHFISHKLSDGGMTVFTFVKIHYLDEQVVDSDYDQDMTLPYKNPEVNIASLTWLTVPENFEFSIRIPHFFAPKVQIFSNCPIFISNDGDTIFRPPILI